MNKYLHHVCIQTNNYSKSLEFYLNVLQFKLEKETPNFHGRQYNTWISLGNFMIEMQTPKADEVFQKCSKSNEGIVHMCFCVADIVEEYERIKNAGWNDFILKNNEVIYSVEGGKLFKLIAPEGTIIEIRDNKSI